MRRWVKSGRLSLHWNRGLVLRDTRMVFLKGDVHWTGLRSEPRFVTLMQALKLDRYGPGLSPI